jgi:hypothetical protein
LIKYSQIKIDLNFNRKNNEELFDFEETLENEIIFKEET